MPNYNYGSYPYGNVYHPYNNPIQQPQQNYNMPSMNQYAYVNGIEGAKSFQLAPNQTIMLMDSDNPICYMKSANSMGQSTLRYFKLIEIKESDLKNNQTQLNNDYVLKADFDVLSKRLDELSLIIQKTQNKENEVVNNA